MIGSADGGAERIRCLRRDGAERKEVAKHKDDAFAWNPVAWDPSEGIAAFLPCMQIRGVHGVGLVGDTRVLCLLGLFVGLCGVVWVVLWVVVWVCATRRGWWLVCWVFGVWVCGWFVFLRGVVYVLLLLLRGAAAGWVWLSCLVCGGGLRTQERVLCYFTSHLIASGAGPAPFVRGCRWA